MNKEKYVDESWKEEASKERDNLSAASEDQTDQEKTSAVDSKGVASSQTIEPSGAGEDSSGQEQAFEINFLNYITSLGFQAMIFLGEIPNPVTNETEKNLGQAKFLIDTLTMLKEKTAGNLNDQENSLLESSIYELQMKYVQISQQETSSQGNEKA